jgi:hypothetical protein
MTTKVINEIMNRDAIPLNDHLDRLNQLRQIIAGLRFLKAEREKTVKSQAETILSLTEENKRLNDLLNIYRSEG